MERISIFNYEAFYLDFLEGNLNEEDTALLMAFLEENPDLRIDDAELPSYDEDSLTLNPDFKNSLKQPDLSGAISNDNVEHFMIANTEGLLEESKTEELEAFVSQNPVLAKEIRIYNAVHLEPD